MNENKRNRGITLIALVITVIVLLILAGVTISMLAGDNGIITKSTEAKFMTELSAAKEEFEMFKLQLAMGNNDFNENTLFIGQNSLDYEGKLEEESGSIKTVFVNTNDNHRKKMEVIKGKIYYKTTNLREIKMLETIGIIPNPYDITDEGVLLSSNNNLLLMDENGILRLPESVTEIAEGAFSRVEGIKTIIIPGSVKKIGNFAFAYNQTLEKVIIGDGVKEIGNNAFSNCPELKIVEMADSVTKLGNFIFFDDRALKTVNISNKVTIIPFYCFYNCTSLETITIPENVEIISAYAFHGASKLTEINIPDKLTTIDASAFSGTSNLERINISENNQNFSFDSNILFNKNKTQMIYIFPQAITGTTFNVPSTVTTLSGGQLNNYQNIETVKIPASVTSISVDFFVKKVNTIIVDSNNLNYKATESELLSKNGERLILYFKKDKDVILEETIKTIGNSSFRLVTDTLESIDIPDSVVSYEEQAFAWCSKLSSVLVGENVSYIDPIAFYGLNGLDLSISNKNNYYTYENNTLYNKNKTTLITIIGNPTSYEVASTVTEIGYRAFHNKNKLEKITIPTSVTTVGNSFNYCNALKKIEFPYTVTSIGSTCFKNCNNIEEIIINNKEGAISGAPWGCNISDRGIIYKGLP